jgi:UDPglucose--hexose-1-phosphate uridylyltransferase
MSTEPELRRDPVTGRWAVVAPARAARPHELGDTRPRCGPTAALACPFCEGAEHETPHEVYALRAAGSAPNGPGWRLRVVPNKFPALGAAEPNAPAPFPQREGGGFALDEPDSDTAREQFGARTPPSLLGKGAGGLGFFAYGYAEVLIDCPEHVENPADLSDEQQRDVLLAYRARLVAHAADTRLAHVAVFKNVGAEAGASIAHTHSQLIALPVVPGLIQAELSGADAHFARTGRCVFCELVERERADGARVVEETASFVAVAAYAPRFAYEVWLMPKAHAPRYEAIADDAALELAGLMRRVLRALDAAAGAPAYNWFLHTSPLRAGDLPHYHWHMELMPRTARPAGLEWGFGAHIVTVAPERAASALRAARPAQ